MDAHEALTKVVDAALLGSSKYVREEDSLAVNAGIEILRALLKERDELQQEIEQWKTTTRGELKEENARLRKAIEDAHYKLVLRQYSAVAEILEKGLQTE